MFVTNNEEALPPLQSQPEHFTVTKAAAFSSHKLTRAPCLSPFKVQEPSDPVETRIPLRPFSRSSFTWLKKEKQQNTRSPMNSFSTQSIQMLIPLLSPALEKRLYPLTSRTGIILALFWVIWKLTGHIHTRCYIRSNSSSTQLRKIRYLPYTRHLLEQGYELGKVILTKPL